MAVTDYAYVLPKFGGPVADHDFQKIENLDALVNLEELWLGKNKITALEVSQSLFPAECLLIFTRT